MTARPKIIIAGPGRSGTSFLMRLLTHCELDTGFTPEDDGFNEELMGGGEIFTRLGEEGILQEQLNNFRILPRILKSPDFSWSLGALVETGKIEVDHVILPVRDARDAAESRMRRGIWCTCPSETYEGQVTANLLAVGYVVEACVVHELPLTIMRYPDFIASLHYCWHMLTAAVSEMVEDVPFARFQRVFQELTERKVKVGV